jgi:rhodanese-related sulfurtransferase
MCKWHVRIELIDHEQSSFTVKDILMKLKYLILIAILIFLFGCHSGGSYRQATIGDLRSKLETDTTTVVLDVRTAKELISELGKLDRIVHIPVEEVEKRINELNSFKEKDIYVICRSGNRSRKASEILSKYGFNPINVQGGMKEWRSQFGAANK